MNYTKGEWKIQQALDDKQFLRTPSTHIVKGDDPERLIATMGIGWENAESNAHLISAAPDMYEALKSIYDGIMANQERLGAGRFDKLTEALIKAEGRLNA